MHRGSSGSRELSASVTKRQVIGCEVVVAITKGNLDFGPSEQIFSGELDGRRQERVKINGT